MKVRIYKKSNTINSFLPKAQNGGTKQRFKNVTVNTNNKKPSYRKDDYIDQLDAADPKLKADAIAMQKKRQQELFAIRAKQQAEINKQKELLYQQMVREDKERINKEQNKPLLQQLSENNKYLPIGEKPKPFIPNKKPGLMEIPYESTPGAIVSKDERLNMFIDKKKKEYLSQTIKKNNADVILNLQNEYKKKINSDKKFRDSNISYDDYLLEKLNDPTYKYKDELLKIYKQKYNENTNFVEKGFDNAFDFLADPLNSFENDVWEGENGRIPQSRFIVRDPNSPFYDATKERLQYDNSPLNSMLNYINPFSSAAEANVDYEKGNYSNMLGNLAEIPLKTVGAVAAPEVLGAINALPLIGGATVGTLLNAGFAGLGAYEAVKGPLAKDVSEAITSGLSSDWRKAVNEGLLVSSYFLGLGELSETMGLARLNNTGKAKNFLPLTLEQYRNLKTLSKAKPLQQVSALEKFTDSKIATDAEALDINNISKPVQSLVDGTVSQRTIPQMMERPALPEPNNIYQQPNFVSDNPGLNAADYLKPNFVSNNPARNAVNDLQRFTEEQNIISPPNRLSLTEKFDKMYPDLYSGADDNFMSFKEFENNQNVENTFDFGNVDDFDNPFGYLSPEDLAALKEEMALTYYDDPVNSNLENDINSFIPTVTEERLNKYGNTYADDFNYTPTNFTSNVLPPPPSEIIMEPFEILPSTIPSNGAANSVNMNLFPGYNSSGNASRAPWQPSLSREEMQVWSSSQDNAAMMDRFNELGFDMEGLFKVLDAIESGRINGLPSPLEFQNWMRDVAENRIPFKELEKLPDSINSLIPDLTMSNEASNIEKLDNVESWRPRIDAEQSAILGGFENTQNYNERITDIVNKINELDNSLDVDIANDIKKTLKNVLNDKIDLTKRYDPEIYTVEISPNRGTDWEKAAIEYNETDLPHLIKVNPDKIIKTKDLDKTVKYLEMAVDKYRTNLINLTPSEKVQLYELESKLGDLYGTQYLRQQMINQEGLSQKAIEELEGASLMSVNARNGKRIKNLVNKNNEVIGSINVSLTKNGQQIGSTGVLQKYHGYNWKHDFNPKTNKKFESKQEAIDYLTERLMKFKPDFDTPSQSPQVWRETPISKEAAAKEAKEIFDILDLNSETKFGDMLYGATSYGNNKLGYGKIYTSEGFVDTPIKSPITGEQLVTKRAKNFWRSKSNKKIKQPDGTIKTIRSRYSGEEIKNGIKGYSYYNYKKGGDPSKLKMFI